MRGSLLLAGLWLQLLAAPVAAIAFCFERTIGPKVGRSAVRLLVLWALLLLIWAVPAQARIWIVESDPSQPEDQIGRVVQTAASGDTVDVGPGVYFEHIAVDRKSITLRGREGATRTILDGSRPIPGRDGSIVYSVGIAGMNLTVEGLTFTHGSGGVSYQRLTGGAINWWNMQPGGSFTARSCAFRDNRVDNGIGSGYGGAIFLQEVRESLIEGCEFAGNYAQGAGGAVYDETMSPLPHRVLRCRFDVGWDAALGGAALCYSGDAAFSIESSLFMSTWGDEPTAITMSTTNASLRFNDFVATGGIRAARAYYGPPGGWDPGGYLEIVGNRYWTDQADSARCIEVQYGGGSALIEDNMFVRCPILLEVGAVEFVRNCAYYSPTMVASGISSCVVTWPYAVHDGGYGSLQIDRNVVEDPMFCGDAPGRFEVDANSPCIQDPLLPGCGVIGGAVVGCGTPTPTGACCLAAGTCQVLSGDECSQQHGTYQGDHVPCEPNPCQPIPTEATSWGRIKAMFRERR